MKRNPFSYQTNLYNSSKKEVKFVGDVRGSKQIRNRLACEIGEELMTEVSFLDESANSSENPGGREWYIPHVAHKDIPRCFRHDVESKPEEHNERKQIYVFSKLKIPIDRELS